MSKNDSHFADQLAAKTEDARLRVLGLEITIAKCKQEVDKAKEQVRDIEQRQRAEDMHKIGQELDALPAGVGDALRKKYPSVLAPIGGWGWDRPGEREEEKLETVRRLAPTMQKMVLAQRELHEAQEEYMRFVCAWRLAKEPAPTNR